MKQFEFDMIILAPTREDANTKMQALNAIGKHLSLSELIVLANTVSNPIALSVVKTKLGL